MKSMSLSIDLILYVYLLTVTIATMAAPIEHFLLHVCVQPNIYLSKNVFNEEIIK